MGESNRLGRGLGCQKAAPMDLHPALDTLSGYSDNTPKSEKLVVEAAVDEVGEGERRIE